MKPGFFFPALFIAMGWFQGWEFTLKLWLAMGALAILFSAFVGTRSLSSKGPTKPETKEQ